MSDPRPPGGDVVLEDDAERVLSAVSLEPLHGKRLLLTGASGLLGTQLLACLARARSTRGLRAEIVAVVRNEPPRHVAGLLGGPGVRVLRGDLTDATFRCSLPESDFVIHASCYAQPALFEADPVETLSLGTEVTLDLLRRSHAGSSFLFVSSSEVYNGLSGPPFRESQIGTTTPLHPRACYIEGKRAGEAICNAFLERGRFARSARVALAYGPGTRRGDQRVLNTFIESALTRGEISMRDRGEALRTYAYVTDVTEMLWRILLDGRDPVYNVGGESTTSIADLARTIGELTGASVRFPEAAVPLQGAPESVRLDLRRTRDEFGKSDYVPLREGLARTVEWQRAIYATP
jgi:UDP-glucuronate decarboxylase